MTTGIPLNPGTSANAGVAQTAHNAQQIARQRDRRRADQARNAARLRRSFELRLAAPEEIEHEQPTVSPYVDGHVPQQQRRQPIDKLDVRRDQDQDRGEQPSQTDPPSPTPDDDRGNLYRHLDLTA